MQITDPVSHRMECPLQAADPTANCNSFWYPGVACHRVGGNKLHIDYYEVHFNYCYNKMLGYSQDQKTECRTEKPDPNNYPHKYALGSAEQMSFFGYRKTIVKTSQTNATSKHLGKTKRKQAG